MEALLSAVLIGTLCLLSSSLVIKAIRFFQFQSAKVEMQRDARVSMDIIDRLLRQAIASTIVLDRSDANQPRFSRITFSTAKYSNVKFYQSGKKLILDTDGKLTLLTQNLQYVTFGFADSGQIDQVSVTILTQKLAYQSNPTAFQLKTKTVRVMN